MSSILLSKVTGFRSSVIHMNRLTKSSQQILKQFKSSLATTTTEPLTNDSNASIPKEGIAEFVSAIDDTEELDFTSDKTKLGTPSPWSVFDSFGENIPEINAAEELLLSPDSVKIRTLEEEEAGLKSSTNESDILGAYDNLLKQRSSVHFGYPYNLAFDHEELYDFMKYSINNLGDPFVTSNYGVHSRQFECAVIDFFANLWQIPKDENWGYVTTW